MDWDVILRTLVAGMAGSFACGLGAIPLAFEKIPLKHHIGKGYALAAGLMVAASVYNLLFPALEEVFAAPSRIWAIGRVLVGLMGGCLVISWVEAYLSHHEQDDYHPAVTTFGSRMGLLVFVSMTLHSMPEGVAIGVGYGAENHGDQYEGLGLFIAIAIAIHNIPEGLAVALPMRLQGASIWRCFWAAFATSLPQPLAAVPASMAVWLFQPLMLPFLGFAAGAMLFLVMAELIPEALETESRSAVAWYFMTGFCLMVSVQAVL